MVKSQVGFALWSRETLLLLNNLMLVVAASMILLGTLYPLLLDALSGAKLSVGPPYFNAMFLPLMAALMAALAVGVLVRWKDTPSRWLLGMLTPVLVASAVLAAAGSMYFGDFNWAVLAVFLLSAWVVLAGFRDFLDKTRHKGVLAGARSLTRSYWGMQLAHLGIAVCAIGIVLSSQYSAQRDLRMSPRRHRRTGRLPLPLRRREAPRRPNYTSDKGQHPRQPRRQEIATLHPEKRLYTVQSSMMTEAGIDAGFTRDLHVALGEPLENGAWAVRVHVKPFVRWIWFRWPADGPRRRPGGARPALPVKVKTRVREALGLAGQGLSLETERFCCCRWGSS
ncbi:cytochrome c-type biogenesis CcmF C-terminal domain-containing protein [Pseudomonas aeruginosa]